MNKSEFRRLVEQKTVILDGATGTELAKRGMPAGVCPEAFVMEHPETIIDIHNAYFAAGSDIVYIPSFGANRLKLKEFGLDNSVREINCRLAEIAKRNAAGRGWVFGDISPVGEFLKPWGNLEFEELIAIYAEQIAALAEGGADGLAIETMLDLQQTRAALIAAKETAPELPVITTLTFDEHERTLSGNDPLSALITLQSLGADAFGCNCSTGPESMIELIRKIKPYAAVPLVAKPNAGMPKLINDKTVFEMTPETFGSFADAMHEAGVNIAGGCCGSSPDHIAELAARLKNLPPPPVACTRPGMVTCAAGSVALNDHAGLKIIGERINPTGKKRLQAELRAGSLELVRDFARQQLEQGAELLGSGGVEGYAVDSILVGVHRGQARLGQQIGAKQPAGHVGGGLLRVDPLARGGDFQVHPSQPCAAAEGTDRLFPQSDLPQTQKLLRRQPQADHVLPIYRRLLQTPGQQGGEPVNPRRVQQNDFFLLFQYMCLFSHNKTSLYLIIP